MDAVTDVPAVHGHNIARIRAPPVPRVACAMSVTNTREARRLAYQMPPSATVIASPFTPPAASLHRNAITCATSRGSSTRFCG